jgi:Calcineurin-like phosphoesterase
MPSQSRSCRSLRRAKPWFAVSIAALALSGVAGAQSNDPVIFSFATVGDSRTDPGKADATTLLANPSPATQGGAPSLTGTILPQDNEWVTNTAALAKILSGIQGQNPNLLFFNGDMIFGYGRPTLPTAWANGKPNSWTSAQTVSPDVVFEYIQYAYWRGMMANLFQTGTYVIPVPGNHETQCSYSAEPYTSGAPNPNCNTAAQGNLTGKTAYADNENMFRFNTSDLVQDLMSNVRFSNVSGYFATSVAGLTQATAPGGASAYSAGNVANNGPISSNQADLTYSFDIQAQPGLLLHFVVINTDPAGADSTAPSDWLAGDFAAAKARGANKYFVFGHKPAFTYNYAAATGGNVNPPLTNSPGPGGLDANFTTTVSNGVTSYGEPFRNAFWSVIAQYGATYFSGHEHTVNVSQNPDPTGTYPGSPYQVIVGSGGSPFDDKLVGTCSAVTPPGCVEPTLTNPYDRFYAWALVSVHASGNVSLQVSGFSDQLGPVQDLGVYDVALLQ